MTSFDILRLIALGVDVYLLLQQYRLLSMLSFFIGSISLHHTTIWLTIWFYLLSFDLDGNEWDELWRNSDIMDFHLTSWYLQAMQYAIVVIALYNLWLDYTVYLKRYATSSKYYPTTDCYCPLYQTISILIISTSLILHLIGIQTRISVNNECQLLTGSILVDCQCNCYVHTLWYFVNLECFIGRGITGLWEFS